MTKQNEDPGLSLDEQAMLNLAMEANLISRGANNGTIEIDGKKWKLRPTSTRQNVKMLNLDYEILYCQNELKSENIPLRKAKRLNRRIRKAYAKKAAYKLVGYRRCFIPFYYALTWRRIYRLSEKVISTINVAESIGDNKDFFLANLGSSKRALGLSTIPVGNAVRQLQERKESAESMLDEDALPKKKEDSKSDRPSKPRRTTRR